MLRIVSFIWLLWLAVPITSEAAYNMIQTDFIGKGNVNEADQEGNAAFLAMDSGLTVLDMTTASSPVVMADVATPAPALGVEVADGIAYVAAGSAGVLIYDVTVPSSPQLIATHSFNALHLLWQAGHLYVCGGTSGLRILDVSTPSSPTVISTFPSPVSYYSFEDIEVSGDVAYVGIAIHMLEGGALLYVLNIATNPPQQVGYFNGGYGGPLCLALGQGYLFAMSDPDQNYVLNVDNPASPTVVRTFSTGQTTRDLTYANGYLYAFMYNGLRIYRVGVNMSETHAIDYPAGGRGNMVGNRLYHACRQRGLQVLELPASDWALPVSSWDRLTSASRFTRAGDLLYVCGERLWVVDVSNPAAPQVIGSADVQDCRGAVLSGNYLYVASYPEGLVTIDVTDPHAPAVVNVIPGTQLMDVTAAGGFLYVAEHSGLRIYDLADPVHPNPRGFLALSDKWYIALYGNYAYISSANVSTSIVDISNPDAPVLAGSIPGSGFDVEISDGRLYIARGSLGLKIYDLTNPVAPVLLGSKTFGSTRGLGVSGTRVYLADSFQGVQVVDATDPANPVLIGSHEPNPSVQFGDAIACGNYVYGGAFFNGMYVYELTGTADVGDPGRPDRVVLSARPNPFSSRTTVSFNVATAGTARLRIYDAAGRLIRTWTTQVSPGENGLTWDGRDSAGHVMPAGTYFLKIAAGSEAVTGSLTLVR